MHIRATRISPRRILLQIFACAFMTIVAPASAVHAVTYYIDTSGNNASDGLTPGTAWQTIAKVNSFQSSLVAGDQILFQRGDAFSGALAPTKSGTAGSPIVYGAYDVGTNPRIDGQGNNAPLAITNTNYLRFENITISEGSLRCVGMATATIGITFSGALITNCVAGINPTSGTHTGTTILNTTVKTATSNGFSSALKMVNLVISGSTFKSITGVGIQVDSRTVTSSGVTITNTIVNGASSNGVYIRGLDNVNITGLTSTGNVKGMWMEDFGSGVIIRSSNLSRNSQYGLQLDEYETVRTYGLTASGNTLDGITIGGVEDTSFFNTTAVHNGGVGIQIGAARDISFSGGTLQYNTSNGINFSGAGSSGAVIGVNSSYNRNDGAGARNTWSGLIFDGNSIIRNGINGVGGADGDGISFHDTSSGIIRNNFFRDNYKSGVAHIGGATSQNYNNIFTHITGSTLAFGYVEGTGSHVFYNNTFYSPGGVGYGIDANNTTTVRAINNAIVNVATGISKDAGVTMVARYNLLYDNTANFSSVTSGGGDVTTDPKFENPASYDFRLHDNSPAIDAGENTGITTDKNAYARFDRADVANSGSGSIAYYDMGAHENVTPTVIVEFSSTTASGNEAAGTGSLQTLTVSGATLTSATTVQVIVRSSSTATQNSDYTLTGWSGTGRTVTIPAGNYLGTAGAVVLNGISVTDDLTMENGETLSLRLGTFGSGAALGDADKDSTVDNPMTYTITDDDAVKVEFSSSAASASEASGTGSFPSLVFSGATIPVGSTVTVQVVVRGSSTATNGADYSLSGWTSTGRTITIPAGNYAGSAGSAIIHGISITDDLLIEGNETLSLRLHTLSGATRADADKDSTIDDPATYTIANNDALKVEFSSTTASGNEAAGTGSLQSFTVSGAIVGAGTTVTVQVVLDSSSLATETGDYTLTGWTGTGKTFTIAAGDYSGAASTLPINGLAIVNDSTVESNETIVMRLGTLSGATIADADLSGVTESPATYTITNDDVAASSSSSSSEEESSGGSSGGGGGGTRGETRDRRLSAAEDRTSSPDTSSSSSGGSSGSSSSAPTSRDTVTPICTKKAPDGSAIVFRDVPIFAWFTEYVCDIVSRGIMSGYKSATGEPLGVFGPGNAVTYGELAKIAHTSAGIEGVTESSDGHWATNYLRSARELEWTVYEDGVDLNAQATRGDVILTLMQASDLPTDMPLLMSPFRDLRTSHPRAAAIISAFLLEILSGDTDQAGNPQGTVRPNDSINRAEITKIIGLLLAKTNR